MESIKGNRVKIKRNFFSYLYDIRRETYSLPNEKRIHSTAPTTPASTFIAVIPSMLTLFVLNLTLFHLKRRAKFI